MGIVNAYLLLIIVAWAAGTGTAESKRNVISTACCRICIGSFDNEFIFVVFNPAPAIRCYDHGLKLLAMVISCITENQ